MASVVLLVLDLRTFIY